LDHVFNALNSSIIKTTCYKDQSAIKTTLVPKKYFQCDLVSLIRPTYYKDHLMLAQKVVLLVELECILDMNFDMLCMYWLINHNTCEY